MDSTTANLRVLADGRQFASDCRRRVTRYETRRRRDKLRDAQSIAVTFTARWRLLKTLPVILTAYVANGDEFGDTISNCCGMWTSASVISRKLPTVTLFQQRTPSTEASRHQHTVSRLQAPLFGIFGGASFELATNLWTSRDRSKCPESGLGKSGCVALGLSSLYGFCLVSKLFPRWRQCGYLHTYNVNLWS